MQLNSLRKRSEPFTECSALLCSQPLPLLLPLPLLCSNEIPHVFHFSHFALQEIKKSQLNAALFQLDCQLAKCCHIVAHAKMQAKRTTLLLLFHHVVTLPALPALNRVRAPSMAYKLH